MIIKSMSRKEPSFTQLGIYIFKGADNKYTYTRNLYATDTEGINREFEENFKHLKRQKNSNAIYHEILSISKSSIELEKQKERLLEIASTYIEARAKNCLVFGSLHEADNNLHFHLMISSNELEQKKNHYFSKKQFAEIKKGLEKYVLEKYPELEQRRLINRDKKKITAVSQKEFELKKRTGEITKRETIQYRLTQIFNSSPSKEAFFANLEKNNIQIYVRGNTIGFKDLADETQRKYRLKKLGLSAEFNKMSELIARELKPEMKPDHEPAQKTTTHQPVKTKEQEALDELTHLRANRKTKTKKIWAVEATVQETKKEAKKMFAGIKRFLGIDEVLNNNEEIMNGNTSRPNWEREDGTIDKQKQEEALKELTLQRGLRKNKVKTMNNF